MSEKMLRVNPSELAFIRLACKNPNCAGGGAVVEVPVATVAAGRGLLCPACQASFSSSTGSTPDALTRLASGLTGVNRPGDHFTVELVLPATE